MKLTALTVILGLGAIPSFSAGETLFKSTHDNGGFGALVVKATSFTGRTDMMTGARAGWIVNHSFIIGGGLYMLTSTSTAPSLARTNFENRKLKLKVNYWGAEFEYILFPESLFHLSATAFLGTGNIGYIDQYDNDFDIKDGVYVCEPGINATININRWCRISGGASYRLISDTSLVGLTNSNMSGISGNFTVRFGRF